MKNNVRNAFFIGGLSAVAYFACYFCKNILSVVSPQIVETTDITVEFIGVLSTCNMFCYAGGQLVNGLIGDRVRTRFLVSGGLFGAGVCCLFVPNIEQPMVSILSYSLIGLFLSMLYAPLVKLIAENTHSKYVMRCCLGLTFASLLGAPVASIFAFFFDWKTVFRLCGIILILWSIICYIILVLFEQKGIVKRSMQQQRSKVRGSLRILVENSIIRFTFVSVLTGIVRTSVVFWIPTYLSSYVGLPHGTVAVTFTILSFGQAVTPYFTNLVIYEFFLKRKMNRMLFTSFTCSTVSFLMMFTIRHPVMNVIFLFLALMSANGASEMIWSVYCPSLRDTGMVSTATGFLDFMSYVAAGVANLLFANAIDTIGWKHLILVWMVLMFLGIIVSMSVKRRDIRGEKNEIIC